MTIAELRKCAEEWLADIEDDVVSDEEDEAADIKSTKERTGYKKGVSAALTFILRELGTST